MNLECGDAFERENAEWIRNNLPTYEAVWRQFIGNAGNNRMLPMHGLHPELEKRRKAFSQAHYSLAVYCFQLDKSFKKAATSVGEIGGPTALHRDLELLRKVVTLIGSIRDMLKQIDESLKLNGSLYGPLQEFYVIRSALLHGPQPPHCYVDGLLKLPKFAGINPKRGEWDDKQDWENVDICSFVYFSDFCDELKNSFHQLLNRQTPQIFDGADRLFGTSVSSQNDASVFPITQSSGSADPLLQGSSGRHSC